MDYYYHGAWRMDWGFGNPNKTATLIACLMISVWIMAYKWKEGFWLALPIFTLLGLCLVQTYSRGGMLALLAGITILIVRLPRPWPRARWMGAVISLGIVACFILYAKAQTRYGEGFFGEDQSINSRLLIWRHVPEMLAAAPSGWGWGNAGDAYTQWFQPPQQSVNYLNLLNSHFTWMVEGGWVVSVLYLYAWMAILLLCWPASPSIYKAIPLAVWVAFGVSGCFSHVEESIWLWILPLVFLSGALWSRLQLRLWPKPSSLGVGAVLALGTVSIIVLAGFAQASLPIKVTRQAVTVGRGPDTNVIFVDRKVMGKLYGHTFRRYLERNPDQLEKSTFIITESPDFAMPSRIHQLIVSGRLWQDTGCIKRSQVDDIILINPCSLPEQSRWDNSNIVKTSVYFGEYSQSPARSSWTSYPGLKSILIEGAADFVPSWPQAVLEFPGS